MNVQEALDCMNSDHKLWTQAEDIDHGGGKVTKTITLPWGIGEVAVTLEGMTDAGKRRGAVGSYGEYIRGLIKEQTNDDAITARAQAAASRLEQADSRDSTEDSGGSRVRDTSVQEAVVPQASEAHTDHATQPVGLGDVLTARRVEILDELKFYTARREDSIDALGKLENDLAAVNAALKSLEGSKGT